MDEELYHFGIKGMKWGVRRTPEQLGHKRGKKRDAGGDAEDTGSAAGKGGAGAGRGGSASYPRYGELKDKLDRGKITQREYDEAMLSRRIDLESDPKDYERYLQDLDWDKIDAGDRSLLAKIAPKGKNDRGFDTLGSTRYRLLKKMYEEEQARADRGEEPKYDLDDLGWEENDVSDWDVKAFEYEIPQLVSQKEWDRARRVFGDQGARDYYMEILYDMNSRDDYTSPQFEMAYERVSKGKAALEQALREDIDKNLTALAEYYEEPAPKKKGWFRR